jgi:hypothetical protein
MLGRSLPANFGMVILLPSSAALIQLLWAAPKHPSAYLSAIRFGERDYLLQSHQYLDNSRSLGKRFQRLANYRAQHS